MKHKLFTLLLAMIASIGTLFASDIQVNGIWYIFDSSTQTATVTYQGSSHVAYVNEYSGAVVIPESVSYGGRTYSVTSIGGYAFWECTGLTSVTIPNSVASIGNLAFSGCSGLTSVTIPNSVTSIGIWAFASCSGLTSVTIGNSVTSIGDDAFNHCSSLTSVTIGNSVTSIGHGAFYGCTGLTSIEIPNSVTSIGYEAFYNCSGLTSVTIGNSVTRIGDYAFSGCTGLTSIEIPNSVTSIGSRAFEGCSSLTSVTNYATTPQTITTNVFDRVNISSCTLYVPVGSLAAYKKATIWKNFGTIQAIGGTPCSPISGTCGGNLTWTLSCDSVLSISGTGTMPDFNSTSDNPWYAHRNAIKSVIIGNGVTSIGKAAFYECSSLKSIEFPNSVTNIGAWAFESCAALVSVTIPNSVTSIEDYAFENCSSLDSVTIPNSVTSIGYGAFGNCSGITSLTIGNSLTSIGNFAFYNCTGLMSVTNYAATPQTISSNVFGSVNISACTLQVSVGSVTDYKAATVWKDFGTIQAISGDSPCSSISGTCGGNLTWEISCDSVLTISGTGAMANISSASDIPWYAYRDAIKSIVIGNGVTSIAGNAFQRCTNLTSVTIPNSVTSIGQVAFYECSALTSVAIPNSVTSIGMGAFSYCSSLTSITIPNSVTSIGDDAFFYCTGLTSVTIPNNVTSIGDDAFYNCKGLKSVTIGSGVASIGRNAFYNCSDLNSITNYATTPQTISSNVFSSVNISACTLYVPAESLAAYRTADVWKDFGTIQAIGGDTPCTPISGTCGGNLTWTLSCDSILTISGTGAMANISSASDIPWYAYRDAIRSIVIGNGVTSIEQGAFGTCSNLTSVTIPNSVTSIGQVAFYECTALTSVTIPNSVTSIGIGAFSGCSSLTSVTLPNGITSIEQETFGSCSSLTSVVIPDGVTSIGDWAFQNCTALTSVTIPSSVTNISDEVFSGCTALSSVTNYATTPQAIDEYVFDGVNISSCTLHVPAESVEAYKAADVWKEFWEITTIGAEGIEDAQSDQVQNTKILRNGQIFIQRGEKIYTITGQEIQSY